MELIAVTPACNEAEHLPSLAASIAAQRRRPDRWVIVTNGCSDDTEHVADEIAARAHPDWVRTLHLGTTGRRSFAAKAHAVASGVESVGDASLLACIDADVVLPPEYFERVAARFESDPTLGITGGVYREPVGRRGRIGGHRGGHVPGPAQVMRLAVYDQIGGYRPLPFGGLDAVACYAARAAGWTTEVIDDLEYGHSRIMGTGGGVSRVRAEYLKGRQDWSLGNAWWFELPKLILRSTSSPLLVGALSRGVGYIRGMVSRTHDLEPELEAYVRREQAVRLRRALWRCPAGTG